MRLKQKFNYAVRRDYEPFGIILAEARTKLKLSQSVVAMHLGYSSAQFISNFERVLVLPPTRKLKILLALYKLDKDIVLDELFKCKREKMAAVLKVSGKKRR
ncbi:MAG: XRE family transcriptional regulator [Proteobacteria bacterium]|nr:MAG: XRE family transcriptional regulator [Pseudomonadota bacterium]